MNFTNLHLYEAVSLCFGDAARGVRKKCQDDVWADVLVVAQTIQRPPAVITLYDVRALGLKPHSSRRAAQNLESLIGWCYDELNQRWFPPSPVRVTTEAGPTWVLVDEANRHWLIRVLPGFRVEKAMLVWMGCPPGSESAFNAMFPHFAQANKLIAWDKFNAWPVAPVERSASSDTGP